MMLRVTLVALAVVMSIALSPALPSHSQDLGSELAAALVANQQAVETIQRAEVTTSAAEARTQVLQAVSQAQAARASLQNALALATADEQRSRIEGLIDHLDAAIDAGLEAQTAPDAAIRGIVAAVRGELVEALAELRPFAPEVSPLEIRPTQPAPQQLPRTGDGWVGLGFLSLLAASGLSLLLVGLKIRSVVRPL